MLDFVQTHFQSKHEIKVFNQIPASQIGISRRCFWMNGFINMQRLLHKSQDE